jgi:hypothetical protein
MTKTLHIASQTSRQSERGNALFLILIAVILFAALSYAITQSNRSGANPSRETNLIASTTVTQYPSAIRTAITRMLLRGAAISDLDFMLPDDANFSTAPVTYKVFHPNGGGAVYQNVDPNTVTLDASNDPEGDWAFLTDKVVTNIGTSTGDVVAVLTNVRTGICQRINEQITGDTTIPASGLSDAQAITDGANPFTGAGITGQPFLCVSTSDSHNVYYHVLAEQ